MKLSKFRPFHSLRFEQHGEWLAAMARQGWHYKGQAFSGIQQFVQGAPAEMQYCWDRAPAGSEDAARYRQQCRDKGWEMAASVGRWLCWSRPATVGHAAPALREPQCTQALYRRNEYQHWLTAAMACAASALNVRSIITGLPRLPDWDVLLVVVMFYIAIRAVRDALQDRRRVRALAPHSRVT